MTHVWPPKCGVISVLTCAIWCVAFGCFYMHSCVLVCIYIYIYMHIIIKFFWIICQCKPYELKIYSFEMKGCACVVSLWIWGYILCHQLSFGQLQQFCCFEKKVHVCFGPNPEHGYTVAFCTAKHSVTLHIPRFLAFPEKRSSIVELTRLS